MNLSKRRMLRAVCVLACTAAGGAAMGQPAQLGFPSHSISLMVPYPAGSASDLTARSLHELIGKALGTQVIVENLGGAGGALAASKVLLAPADGHLVFQGSPSELILNGLANKSTRYKPEDFQFVAPVARSALVVVVNSQLPVQNIDELIELMRKRRGQPLSYGSPGPGTLYHLLGELFSKRIGVPATHVPYKGGTPLLQDLAGGQIDFAFLPYQSIYADHVRAGRLRLIGSLTAKRLPAPFESVAPVYQHKLLKDFSFSIWTAYLVRKGTPRPVAERLNAAVTASLADAQARAQLEAQAKTIFETMSLDAGERFYAEEIARYRDLVKTIGFEAQ